MIIFFIAKWNDYFLQPLYPLDMSVLLTYLIAMAITPGPNTILSMANAAASGLRKGIWLNIGMLAGITAVTAISYAASAFLYSFIPNAEPWLKAIGAVYLIYLAYRTYKKSAVSSEERSAGFAEGFLLQLINFKVYLLALTAISAMIIPEYGNREAGIAVSLLIPIVCFICGLIWAIAGSLISGLYRKHGKILGAVMALLLIYTAIRLFV